MNYLFSAHNFRHSIIPFLWLNRLLPPWDRWVTWIWRYSMCRYHISVQFRELVLCNSYRNLAAVASLIKPLDEVHIEVLDDWLRTRLRSTGILCGIWSTGTDVLESMQHLLREQAGEVLGWPPEHLHLETDLALELFYLLIVSQHVLF